MAVERKFICDMFKIDNQTQHQLIKLNHNNEDDVITYFEKLFNILHKDIINESKNRYAEYIVKHTELKNKLKKLIKNKNNYQYKYYTIMLNDIEEEIYKHEREYYDIFDDKYKILGKSKFLLDEQCYENEKLMKKLNKLKNKLYYLLI